MSSLALSSVQCVQDKYEFSICEEFDAMVKNLDKLSTSEEILESLEDIFKLTKQKVLAKNHINNIDLCDQSSHIKLLYCEKEINHGTFKIEAMQFTGVKPTCLHTHPEFVIDEVISGELVEESFAFNTDDTLTFSQRDIREEGSFKKVYDPSGNPHKVTAKGAPCITLCISLGKNIVESHSES